MTFKVTVVNKFSENVLHKGRNGAGGKAELFLTFLSCLGVHILGYAFAVDSRREPTFVEVVVYHRHASCATLAYLPLVGLKLLLRRGLGEGGFTYLGRLRFGHFCVCTADFSVNSHGCLLLHGVGDMAVDVERGFRADVAYHSGESLDIHAIFKCHRSEGVAQIMETYLSIFVCNSSISSYAWCLSFYGGYTSEDNDIIYL